MSHVLPGTAPRFESQPIAGRSPRICHPAINPTIPRMERSTMYIDQPPKIKSQRAFSAGHVDFFSPKWLLPY